MAKNRGNDGSNGNGQSNRFRFVMLEGELSDGNMNALAQAITTALRPLAPTPAPAKLAARNASAAASALAGAGEPVTEVEGEELEEIEEVEYVQPAIEKVAKDRTYTKPKVMNDVDLEGDVSFPDFAASKKPKTVQDRYLIAAAWYKQHRQMPSITMHHVYTCFLHPKVKWSTTAADFDQPLRHLVKVDKMGRGSTRGHYEINAIGMADVAELETE